MSAVSIYPTRYRRGSIAPSPQSRSALRPPPLPSLLLGSAGNLGLTYQLSSSSSLTFSPRLPSRALARPGALGRPSPPSLGGSLAGLRSEFREPEALQDVDRRRNRYLGRQGAAPQSRPFSWPVCALRRGRSKSGERTDGREPHFIVLIGRKTRRLRGSRRRPGRAAAARWPVA